MIIRRPRTEDICVRILPDLTSPVQENLPIRAYEVAVYAALPLQVPQGSPSRVPAHIRDIPLLTRGKLTLKWARYQDILAQFFDGEKGLEAMQFRIRDWLSPELLLFVDQLLTYPSPISIWWSVEAPELEDIPWEVLFYAKPNVSPPTSFKFFRGIPPESPTPVLPVAGPLRVMWLDGPSTPLWLRGVFKSAIPGLEFVPTTGRLRQAFRYAANQGFEIFHSCSDGAMTLAYEGVLRCAESDERPLSAAELSDIVTGSRTSIIALTAITAPSASQESQTDAPVEVYRAFASLASSKVRLPSMIAPIGPTDQSIASFFWQTFYSNFATSHRLDASFAAARLVARASTFALFLRHSHGTLFRPVEQNATVSSPAQIATELQQSLEFSERVKAINAKYGALPDYLNSFTAKENERRSDIESELGKWTATEAEE